MIKSSLATRVSRATFWRPEDEEHGQRTAMKNKDEEQGRRTRAKNSNIPSSQYQSNTRPTTIYFKSSPQLQEVIYRSVNSDHQKSTSKHEKGQTYDWKQNRNNLSLNFHESEKYIDVRKV